MESKYSARLKGVLDTLDIKQNELAKKTGITEATISNYINAKKMPQLSVVEKIADVLDISVDYLLGRTDSMKSFKDYTMFIDINPLISKYNPPSESQKELIKDLIEVVLKNNKK